MVTEIDAFRQYRQRLRLSPKKAVIKGATKWTGVCISKSMANKLQEPDVHQASSDLPSDVVAEISHVLRGLLADVYALYLKTKNFHWHMSGPQFRDYHLLLDEHAEQLFGMTDDIAERARKLGGVTLRSISDITRNQRLKDNNEGFVEPQDMMTELLNDNRQLTSFLRSAHEVCGDHNDVATTSLIEVWIDQTERRAWFLSEIVGRR